MELNNIVDEITKRLSVEKIYSHIVDNGQDKINHLIILLPPSSSALKFSELEPFVKMAISEQPNITFALYHTSEVRNALKEGNLYFYFACINANLLFDKPEYLPLSVPSAADILKWKEESNARFTDAIGKTARFLEGAEFFLKKADNGLTVFMLHQVAELTYRALELFILTKEKRTHNITAHQTYLLSFLPQIGMIFSVDSQEEMAILKTLNEAYSAVRYQQDYLVNESHVPILLERINKLQERAKFIADELTQILEVKAEETKALEILRPSIETISVERSTEPAKPIDEEVLIKPSLHPALLESVLIIEEKVCPDQIYLFGNIAKQTDLLSLFTQNNNFAENELHFDLLVISPVINPYSTNIVSLINPPDRSRTINLLIHTKDEVIKQIENGSRFFQTVVLHGNIIYLKNSFVENVIFPNKNALYYYDKTKAYSTRRMQRAKEVLQAATSVKNDVKEVVISLLAQSMEQVCLGLIYCFWGYQPNLHSLPHLLNICYSFWPENDISFFPMQTEYDKKLLTTLSRSYSELRFNVGNSIGQGEFDAIFLRCNIFIELAEGVYTEELVRLKEKTIEEEV